MGIWLIGLSCANCCATGVSVGFNVVGLGATSGCRRSELRVADGELILAAVSALGAKAPGLSLTGRSDATCDMLVLLAWGVSTGGDSTWDDST